MLSGVLLHVVASARGVDGAVDGSSLLEHLLDEVEDFAVFVIGDFGDGNAALAGGEGAGVERLSAAGGIEGRLVEQERGASADVAHFRDARGEGEEVRVGIVQAMRRHQVLVKALSIQQSAFS
jgi:hypothetical protein